MPHSLYRVHFPFAEVSGPRAPTCHVALFMRTEIDGRGYLFHVRADIDVTTGLTYRCEPQRHPMILNEMAEMTHLGSVHGIMDVDMILRRLPAIQQQWKMNVVTGEYERCKPDGTSYVTGELPPPIQDSEFWVDQMAIPELESCWTVDDRAS